MFILLDWKMNQEEIEELNDLIGLHKSNFTRPSDALMVAFHWGLVKHGFRAENNPVRKMIFLINILFISLTLKNVQAIPWEKRSSEKCIIDYMKGHLDISCSYLYATKVLTVDVIVSQPSKSRSVNCSSNA